MAAKWVLALGIALALVAVAASAYFVLVSAQPAQSSQTSGGGLAWRWGFARGLRAGFAKRGFAVQLSDEFTSKVKSILEADPDTSKLLKEGYNVTAIRPVITATISGDGTVTLKATQAIVALRKDNSWAVVRVDVAQGKVVSISIITRTVIQKG